MGGLLFMRRHAHPPDIYKAQVDKRSQPYTGMTGPSLPLVDWLAPFSKRFYY